MRLPSSVLMVLVLSAAWLSGPSVDAQQQGTDQRPKFRSGVEVVTVDVGVIDKDGRPVRGLGPSDFNVTVAGQPRRVVTAEFIDVDETRAAYAGGSDVVPISTNEGGGVGRMIMFVVDGGTLEVGDARQVAAAAARFFSGLTYADRSAVVTLPIGRTVEFTFAHDRVRDALMRSPGTSNAMNSWEYGSLSEARDIVTRGSFALRDIGARECASSLRAGGDLGADSPGSLPLPGSGASSPSPGNPSGGSGDGSSTGTSGTSSPRRPSTGNSTSTDLVADRCMRELQSTAEMAWGMAQANTMSSVTALRQVLAALARVPGDKTLVLISGGWPMDEREQISDISIVADEAAAAKVTLFSLFVPHWDMSASRSRTGGMSMTDHLMYSWALENLAAMTGGRSFKADAAPQGVFDRLSRELSGFYRIAVERNAVDASASAQRLKVQVPRNGVTVRARQIFDAPTYEDRDWSARFASALESPAPVTDVAIRLTHYLAPDPDDPGYLRVVLAGDASRVQPGAANLRVVVHNLEGKRILTGEQRLGDVTDSALPFSTNVRLPLGSYMVRLAVMDGAGRVGSVDHRVEARPASFGAIAVTGPVLVEVPAAGQGQTRVSLDGVQRDERLAMQVGLEGDAAKLATAQVVFELAATPDGPALIQQTASLSSARARDGAVLAQAMADVGLLPAGQYLARVKVKAGGEPIAELHRAFAVIDPFAAAADDTPAPGVAGTTAGTTRSFAAIRGRAVASVQPFAVADVLSPQVLNGFLDRVAARPDAAMPAAAELLHQARAENIAHLKVSDAQAAQTPIGAFLRGLALLAQNQLDPAAGSFRSAMRASPDFYPAMVYLGACYAAGGKDKEAAAAWRTALIKEGDARALHLMLGDALLRAGSADLALQTLATARARWPEDDQLKQRFVTAALVAGRYGEALQTFDDLLARGAADEASHALALLVLYESLTTGRPIEGADQDRARMLRLADAYRARGGPALALVETWVAAVKK